MKLSYLRYAVFRWMMPRLSHEPLFHMNLAQKAWPRISAFTAQRQYTDQIESIECGPEGGDGGILEEYAKISRPVVIKGYINTESTALCTLDRVQKEVGDTEGRVRVGDYDEAAGEPDYVKMRVADFIDNLTGQSEFPHKQHLVDGKGPYLANMKLPTLAKQLPLPSLFPASPDVSTFWLGTDSVTPLHCHLYCDVLLVQLVGRRRVMLIPPHQAPLVGCIPRNINICTANFDPFEPNHEQFPGADVIHKLHYELEAGDALLIPGFWFHAVRLTGTSFACSQFNETMMPLALGGGGIQPWQERAYTQGWG